MSIKKKFLNLMTPVLAGTFLLAVSCTSDSNPNSTITLAGEDDINTQLAMLAVKPPINGLDVPFNSYKVPVSKGMTIETATGTIIEIPADAFVDKDGNAITGDVDVKFREFHDATDIIASGIPMHNHETGAYMETAGMFEIQGEHGGQAVFVNKDKDIVVNLASFNEGDQFQFYELGEKDGHWDDKGTAPAKPNEKKLSCLKALDKKLPAAPVKPRKQSNVENYVFELDVNYSTIPELKPYKGVVWEYAGEGSDPEKNEWIFSSNWDKIALNPSKTTGYFELVLSNKDKKFNTLVRPVLDDKDYDKALAAFSETKLKEYEAIRKAQQAERDRLGMQADLVRTFSVNGFGTYNWDIWHNPDRTKCAARPQFDQLANVDSDINKMSFYLVMGTRRSVVNYSKETLDKFSFNPNDNNALLAILPEGKVAVFSAADFKKLNLQQIKNDKSAILKMATKSAVVKSLDDLDALIDSALLT